MSTDLTKKSYFWPEDALSPIDALLWIKHKIKTKTPCSFIRLGDGEFRVIGYPSTAPWAHTSRSLKIWFGRDNFPEHQLIDLAEDLRKAVRNSDLIGLPRLSRQMQVDFFNHIGFSWKQYQLATTNQAFTDCSVHRLWQVAGGYWDLLHNLPFLGLISCRDIGQKISDIFEIDSIKLHPIPSEKIHPGSFESSQEHFPERFFELINEIKVPYTGAVFLVGAGGLGKIYCEHIKNQGGIAIDVGSVLDGWASCFTRNFLKQEKDLYSIEKYKELKNIDFSSRVKMYQEKVRTMYYKIPLDEKDKNYYCSTNLLSSSE